MDISHTAYAVNIDSYLPDTTGHERRTSLKLYNTRRRNKLDL